MLNDQRKVSRTAPPPPFLPALEGAGSFAGVQLTALLFTVQRPCGFLALESVGIPTARAAARVAVTMWDFFMSCTSMLQVEPVCSVPYR